MFYMTPVNGTHTIYFIYSTILRSTVVILLAAIAFLHAPPAAASSACITSSGSWANQFFAAKETGSFRVVYDAIPSATTMDAVSGISYGFANEYTDLAAAVRFNLNGSIDARSGSGFTAANYIAYSKNVTYHFIFDVNLATHTYSIYVVVGSTQKTVGSNLKFRTEQSNNQYLNSVGTLSATGTVKLCNVVLFASSTSSSGSLLLSPSATSLNFGNVGISAGGNDQNITLKNTGTSNVTISKVAVSGAGFTANGGAAGLTLAPQQSTTVRATFDPAATGKYTGALSITSNATNSPSNIALSGTGVMSATHAITLTWQAAFSGTVGYKVYVGSTSGGPYSRLNTSTVTGTSFVDAGVQPGQTYFFVVTSINSANKESPRSAEVQAAVP
jgi:hypothetical protein